MTDAFAIGDIMQEELNQTDIKVQEKKEFKDAETQTETIVFQLPNCNCEVEPEMTNFNFTKYTSRYKPSPTKKIKINEKDRLIGKIKKRKEYKCNVCIKTFSKQSHHKDHMNLHYDIRKFVCPYCDRAYVQSSNAKQHIMKHFKT